MTSLNAVTRPFAAFFAAGVALGAPPMLLGLLLAFSSSLNMSLTHYATGTAPIIFGSGYATLNEWWIAGFVMSVVNIAILVPIPRQVRVACGKIIKA